MLALDLPETSYRYCLIRLGCHYYVPLPKLNRGQVSLLQERLTSLGYVAQTKRFLTFKKGTKRLFINPEGLCWSSADPTDEIAPMMPELLELKKERIGEGNMLLHYADVLKMNSTVYLRLKTRLEHGRTWLFLRKNHISCITPDEYYVFKNLLQNSEGTLHVLANYPSEKCKTRIIGARRYFIHAVSAKELSEHLYSSKRMFLPKNNIIRLRKLCKTRIDFSNLGQWCYYC